jgi:hypothetical protein
MVALLGMSIAKIPATDMGLVSIQLLRHIQSLISGDPRWNLTSCKNMGGCTRVQVYLKQQSNFLLEKRRMLLGEEHRDTLMVMNDLAITYSQLGRLNEANKLQVVVLEKWRRLLG